MTGFSPAEVAASRKPDQSVRRGITPSRRDTDPIRKTTNLGIIELQKTRTPEGSTHHFDYYTTTYSLKDFVTAIPDPERRADIIEALERLGVDDFSFSVHSREGEKLSEAQLKSSTLYVCAHGWTASGEIYTDVLDPNRMSVVTRLLNRDPQGIVITFDAPGFGKSTFTKDVLYNDKKLEVALLTDKYAQLLIDLTKTVLGVQDTSRVVLKGHSRGARAALEVAMKDRKIGYKRIELDAPAIALHKKVRRFIRRLLQGRNPSEVDVLIDQIWGGFANENSGSVVGVKVSATTLYEALGLSIGTASVIGKLGTKATEFGVGITRALFKGVLYRDLFGKIVRPGRWRVSRDAVAEENAAMWNPLLDIHDHQITETPDRPRQQFINSTSIRQLRSGLDFGLSDQPSIEELDISPFIPLDSVWIIAGEQDTLATLSDIRETIAAMAVLSLFKYERLSENGASREELQQARQAFISASTLLANIRNPDDADRLPWRGRFLLIEGGHYATVYYPGEGNQPSFEEILVRDEEVTKPVVNP